jgi:hypothetical protein
MILVERCAGDTRAAWCIVSAPWEISASAQQRTWPMELVTTT